MSERVGTAAEPDRSPPDRVSREPVRADGAIVILLQSANRAGLVSRITTFFHQLGMRLRHCQLFTDVAADLFFMRVVLDQPPPPSPPVPRLTLHGRFDDLARQLGLSWSIHHPADTPRVAVFVSRAAHCLYDLVLRHREGELACEIPLIVSNHAALEPIARQFAIPFHHVPLTAETKLEQEARIRRFLDEAGITLVVLARYMQVLSRGFVEAWAGRIINIHHSFLPAFVGADPYGQAYQRGVKLIGATAHYATVDLDEGPIIDQDVARVSHEDDIGALRGIGRDIERLVLARAVKAHLEHRVIIDRHRTIVFSAGA